MGMQQAEGAPLRVLMIMLIFHGNTEEGFAGQFAMPEIFSVIGNTPPIQRYIVIANQLDGGGIGGLAQDMAEILPLPRVVQPTAFLQLPCLDIDIIAQIIVSRRTCLLQHLAGRLCGKSLGRKMRIGQKHRGESELRLALLVGHGLQLKGGRDRVGRARKNARARRRPVLQSPSYPLHKPLAAD
ncbi:MAG: hypothetical protein KBA75_06055 [Alphaproteobacteria bacterium]|nr:hypothetical protein [Alphaproteobacteria bacterium]